MNVFFTVLVVVAVAVLIVAGVVMSRKETPEEASADEKLRQG